MLKELSYFYKFIRLSWRCFANSNQRLNLVLLDMSNINKSTQGDQLQLNNLENYSNLVSNETMRTQESSKVQTWEESCLKNKDSNVYTSEQQVCFNYLKHKIDLWKK